MEHHVDCELSRLLEESASINTRAAKELREKERTIEALASQNELLKKRYHDLLKDKERIEAQYEADYKKWREFKSWVLKGGESGDGSVATPLLQQSLLLPAAGTSPGLKEDSPLLREAHRDNRTNSAADVASSPGVSQAIHHDRCVHLRRLFIVVNRLVSKANAYIYPYNQSMQLERQRDHIPICGGGTQ